MHIPITTLATYVSSIVPVGKSVVGAIGSNVLAKETAVERRNRNLSLEAIITLTYRMSMFVC